MSHYYDDLVICTVCRKEVFSTNPRWWDHICWECENQIEDDNLFAELRMDLEEYFDENI